MGLNSSVSRNAAETTGSKGQQVVATAHATNTPTTASATKETAAPAPAPASTVTLAEAAAAKPAMAAESLQGKVYAVTGGASGIGLATAQILAKRGATVCICDVNDAALKSTEDYFNALNTPFSIRKVDISNRAQVDAWIDDIVKEHGKLDGAANVAGIIGKVHGLTSIAEMEDEDWLKIINVNLTGTFYCLRAEIRKIVDGGSIVNVSSVHGLKGYALHSAYDSSKHAVNGLTKVAAQELGKREIRVNAVAPGAIYTPLMQQNWDLIKRPADAPFDDPTAFQRQGTAEEVAHVIVFLLSPESKFVSGSVYSVDGAWA